jgi:hypothetical protein
MRVAWSVNVIAWSVNVIAWSVNVTGGQSRQECERVVASALGAP